MVPEIDIGEDYLVYVIGLQGPGEGMDWNEINTFINNLKRAQGDAAELSKLKKKEISLLKDYPTNGKNGD